MVLYNGTILKIDPSTECMIVMDYNENITDISQTFSRILFGYCRVDLVGKNMSTIIRRKSAKKRKPKSGGEISRIFEEISFDDVKGRQKCNMGEKEKESRVSFQICNLA